jgi:hypothetical protein
MADRAELQAWIVEALQAEGGSARVVDVCKRIWQAHETDLLQSGDLFYTWQYDVRWAAHLLRREGVLKPANVSPNGIWELA